MAKLLYTLLEALGGLLLLVAGITHHDLVAVLHRAALRELHEDPSDFLARHLLGLRSGRRLSAGKEVVSGAFLIAYTGVKAGVIIGILQRSRLMIQLGAVVFTLLSAAAMVALLRHPSLLGSLVVVLDLAVAVVVIREARRALRLH